MGFEEKFGVKVDLRIPEEERLSLYKIWERILGGGSYSDFSDGNFQTRYEHIIQGSGAGWPPDPFRILTTYQTSPDLEKILKRRKHLFPEGKEMRTLAPPLFFPRFKELTGHDAIDCMVYYINPPIDDNWRVPIPRVVAFQDEHSKQRLELTDKVLQQLQFPTTIITRLSATVKVREIFDYPGEYRIEMAS